MHTASFYLNDSTVSFRSRFGHQGKPHNLEEAIYLCGEVLHLHPVWHKSRGVSLGNREGRFRMRFSQRGGVDDMNRAIGLLREALTLRLPGNSSHDTLNTLALPLQIRYDKLDIGRMAIHMAMQLFTI
ncbi:hypothetical protein BDR07DRAFT_1430453 [Suillus spraguei]|nr:hypothetical protein BDR07DRAFT_1430453 [Suillus spraguei]